MPHRTSRTRGYPLFIRLVAMLLAGALSVPGIAAQPEGAAAERAESPRRPFLELKGSESSLPAMPQNPSQAAPQASKPRLGCGGENLSEDVIPTTRNPKADDWGDITIAQPKIWQFERVSALLDGLLRDVEGISLADLTQLDPSKQNAAALKFIQSALEVGVQYDQAAAVNAANALGNYDAVHASQVQQLNQYNNYLQTLTAERDRLATQYAAASNEVNTLTALKAGGNLTPEQTKQLEEATSRQATTQASLASVNSLISGAGVAPTLTAPPTVTGTAVQGPASGSQMSSSLMGFSDMLKSLPQGVQNNLSSALQSMSYPATKQLDNFITLLYERLAREISVLQDDLTRDPENVAFLLQFDVGLYPSKKAKDHVARVEFNLDCPGCKVYSLYPGQSSYNIANYSGSSKRNTFWGNVVTLFGLGVSASYRRQTDILQGSLVQSVYTAGFQNGVLEDKGSRDNRKRSAKANEPVDANPAEQSFGWYYGPAPFEQVVTPGIRTTFALITVPRDLIAHTQDRFGNADACIPFHIDAGWPSRNDPVAQRGYFSLAQKAGKYSAAPFYWGTRNNLAKYWTEKNPNEGLDKVAVYDSSVLTAMTSVKLPSSLEDYSLIARREKQKLHVLRMEYNTIYEDTDMSGSTPAIQTTVQTTTQSTNQATGQSTGQTTTQTTGTSVSTGNTATSAAASTTSPLSPLPCPKNKCAPILLKLDRPIDPNLAVTVRGVPLMRVRDWRGRATSVLPPAQSGTDLSGSTGTVGSITMNQLEKTRGLLESDQFAPNTWYPLNSHELLLNVSVDVATDEEFPVIQLADPSGSVVIPYDLREGFTELLLDGFRLRPQTERSIQLEVGRHNWPEDFYPSVDPNTQRDAPVSTGPYAFSTYTPLFSPQPVSRSFYVQVGETGDDLLIGFLPRNARQLETDKSRHLDWQEAQTRVILEDRHQDLAWSLSCDVQGDLLACRMPREGISRSYLNFLRACPTDGACPGLESEQQSLQRSLEERVISFLSCCKKAEINDLVGALDADMEKDCCARDQFQVTTLTQERKQELRAAMEQERNRYLTASNDLKGLKNAYVSSLQLWVEQFDREHLSVFYSPEPTRIPFLPISSDYWSDVPFKPWKIDWANPDYVTLRECSYLPGETQKKIKVRILGLRSNEDWLELTPDAKTKDRCGTFPIPTAELEHDPIVFQMEIHSSDVNVKPPVRTTVAISKSRLAPNIRDSSVKVRENVQITGDNLPVKKKSWQFFIPIEHSTCADDTELYPTLPSSNIKVKWLDGENEMRHCPDWTVGPDHTSKEFKTWKTADDAGRIRLSIEIPSEAMKNIPDRIEIVRTTTERVNTERVKWTVATLPSLRRLLLPYRLTLASASAAQFALLGEHAEIIDAVLMQGSDGTTTIFPATPGVDIAQVNLPAPSASKTGSSDTSGGSGTGGSSNSTQISIVTTKDNNDTVKMTQSSTTTPTPSNKPPSTPSSQDNKAAKALDPGTYGVIPLIQIGITPVDEQKLKDALNAANADLKKANAALDQAQKDQKAATTPDAKKAAQTRVTSAQKEVTSAQAKVKTAQDNQKNAKPTPEYMPLKVADSKGMPLTFTVPDTKKQTSTQPSTAPASTTATCVAPCIGITCTAACPQTANPAAATKSP